MGTCGSVAAGVRRWRPGGAGGHLLGVGGGEKGLDNLGLTLQAQIDGSIDLKGDPVDRWSGGALWCVQGQSDVKGFFVFFGYREVLEVSFIRHFYRSKIMPVLPFFTHQIIFKRLSLFNI